MLPKIQHPVIELTIPSTGQKAKFRPMLVKEEKILLIAKETGDQTQIYRAVIQIVNNCVVENNIDVNKLSFFDLEYLFLKIRANSITNIIKFKLKDDEDEREYPFEFDLDKIELTTSEEHNKMIKVNDSMSLQMKYITVSHYENVVKLEEEGDREKIIDYNLINSLDKIFIGDNVHDISTASEKDVKSFIDSLPIEAYNAVDKFLSTVPFMTHTIKYKNAKNNERSITFTGFADFFRFC